VALPILDTSIAVLSRLIRGKSPFEGGRDHLAHRLLRTGMSVQTTSQLLWFLNISFATLAFLLLVVPQHYRNVITIGTIALWAILYCYFWNIPHE
jgi:UDP-GlcNAc:undecaprenyl-phosphate GlcNAc-1-phosphate transferase